MQQKKRKALSLTDTTTKSPDSVITDVNKISQIENKDELTKKQNNELHKLELQPRVYNNYHYSAKDSGNRIIHWDSLSNIIRFNTKCAKCGAAVSLKESTTGIATTVKLTCKNQRYNLNEQTKINRTKLAKYNNRLDSNESFAINCQLVLCLIQMGCALTEAQTLLTYLDLPNGHTFFTKSFSRILDAIRPEIKNITDQCMQDARQREIKETIGEKLFEEYEKETCHLKKYHL